MGQWTTILIIVMFLFSTFSVFSTQLLNAKEQSEEKSTSVFSQVEPEPAIGTNRSIDQTRFQLMDATPFADGGHYPSHIGDIAYFGWVPKWDYNGNRPGYMHFSLSMPRYINYMGNVQVRSYLGGATPSDYTAYFAASDPATGLAGTFHLDATISPYAAIWFEFGFDLQIDSSVPNSFDSLSSVGAGGETWEWNYVDEVTGKVYYQTGYVAGASYNWPIIRPTIDLNPDFGVRGDPVTLYGHDFHASASVAIKFNQTQVASATTDSSGFFVANFNVPSNAAFGIQTVTANSALDPDARNATFTVKRGYNIALDVQPTELVANGKSTAVLTATVTDRQGNPVQGDSVNFEISTKVGMLEGIHGSYNATKDTGADGTVQVTYTSPNSTEFFSYFGPEQFWSGTDPYGTVEFTAQEMTDLNQTAATVLTKIGFTLTVEAKPTSIIANGVDTSTVTATLKDSEGKPAVGLAIDFWIVASIGKLDGSTPTEKYIIDKLTGSDGKATVTFTAPNASEFIQYMDGPQGTINIHTLAYIDNENTSYIENETSIDLSVKYSLTIYAQKTTLSADDNVHLEVNATLQDDKHQLVEGETINFKLKTAIGNIDGQTEENATTGADGNATVTYHPPNTGQFYYYFNQTAKSGTVTIVASVVINATTGDKITRELSITLKPCKLTITASPNPLFIDGKSNSTIKIVLKDGSDTPLSGRIVKFYIQPPLGHSFSDQTTDANGTIKLTYDPINPNDYFNAGGPAQVNITASDPTSQASNILSLNLTYIAISASWTSGTIVEWRPGSVNLGLKVSVTDGLGNKVAGAKVTIKYYTNPMIRNTNNLGVANFSWVHPTGNTPPQNALYLDFNIVATATINGTGSQTNKTMRMVLGPNVGWFDNIPQSFWDNMKKQELDALATVPPPKPGSGWEKTMNSVLNKIILLGNHSASGYDKWKASIGIVSDIVAESKKEGASKAWLKALWTFVDKTEVIINNYSKYFDYLKQRQGQYPPVSDANNVFTIPSGHVTFNCPVNVLIIDPQGYVIGTATSLLDGADYSTNDLWETSDYTSTADQKDFTFYDVPNGYYMVRIVGTADGAYSFTINVDDPSGNLFSQNYSGTIHLNEVQWKIMGVDLFNEVTPVDGLNLTPTVQSCDINGDHKDYFNSNDNVHVFGEGLPPNSIVNLYFLPHQTWTDGDTISGSPHAAQTDANGTTDVVPIWGGPLTAGGYDIIVDVNNNHVYDAGVDALDTNDDIALSGFFVVRTLTVPDDYPTIQAAIDASNSGDTIYIKAGNYSEDITFPTFEKYVSIVGENRLTTKLDGSFSLSPSNPEHISVKSLTIVGAVTAGALFNMSNCVVQNSVDLRGWGGCNIEDNIIEGYLHFLWSDENVALHDIFVKNNTLHNSGILIQGWYGSYSNIIINNTISDAWQGILEEEELPNDSGFSANIIIGNHVSNCYMGIQCQVYSDPWTGRLSSTNITGNTLDSNHHGLWIERVAGVGVWNNNFINNTVQAVVASQGSINMWNSSYPFSGNYWDDYTGTDNNYDGIGDTPYVIDANNIDHYPLMSPWTPLVQPTNCYLVVRGENNNIYYRIYNSTSKTWNSWSGLPGATLNSPAAFVIGNKLHAVVRGVNNDQIWYGNVNLTDNTFSGWTLLSGATPSPPTLTGNSTTLCLVVRGENNVIYYCFYDVSSKVWGDWTGVPNGATTDTPAATLVNNTLQVAVRGVNYDQIWHGTLTLASNSFSGWTLLSGSTPSPSTLTGNSTTLCLVVRGENNVIYYRFFDLASKVWTDWTGFQYGTTPDVPAATITGDSLQIVVRGMNYDQIWHGTLNLTTNTWSGWTQIDGSTPSKPTLTS